jgi:8-oxo-dGTP pyrophosphatase MutT (NUDIX family)
LFYNQGMEKQRRIRVKSLAWIEDQDMLFVVRMCDSVKMDVYYRPIGGSIEFGESSLEAVKREALEEIQAQLEVGVPPLVVENRFVCDGEEGHEIDFLYRCRFIDPGFYQLKTFRLIEINGDVADALWIPIADCLNGALRLVPDTLLEYYQNKEKNN